MKGIRISGNHLQIARASLVLKRPRGKESAWRYSYVDEDEIFNNSLRSEDLIDTSTSMPSHNVTLKTHDLYLNDFNNELHIPGGKLFKSLLLPKDQMKKPGMKISNMDLALEVTWADAHLSLLLDPLETLFVFGLAQTNIFPSADSLVSHHVNTFKNYYRSHCEDSFATTVSSSSSDGYMTIRGKDLVIPVDSSRSDNTLPESLVIEKAMYGSFETGFQDVTDQLAERITEEKVRDTVVARLSMSFESKNNVFKYIRQQVRPSTNTPTTNYVPTELNRLIITFSAGKHRRNIILKDKEPFSIVVIQKLVAESNYEEPSLPLNTLIAQDSLNKRKLIRIVKSEYRYANNVVDVTERVRQLTAYNQLLLPCAELNYLLQVDPKFDQPEEEKEERVLDVEFEVHGRRQMAQVREHQDLIVLALDKAFPTYQTVTVLSAAKFTSKRIEDFTNYAQSHLIDEITNSALIPKHDFKENISPSAVQRAVSLANLFQAQTHLKYVLFKFGNHKIFWCGTAKFSACRLLTFQPAGAPAAIHPVTAVVAPVPVIETTENSETVSVREDPAVITAQPGARPQPVELVPNAQAAEFSYQPEEKIVLVKKAPDETSIIDKAREQEKFQSVIMRSILVYLDRIKLFSFGHELKLGDLFCLVLSQPAILLVTTIWLCLLIGNSHLKEAIIITCVATRSMIDFFFKSFLDTAVLGIILFVYIMVRAPPLVIYLRNWLRQSYEELLIVKTARESSMFKFGRSLAKKVLGMGDG